MAVQESVINKETNLNVYTTFLVSILLIIVTYLILKLSKKFKKSANVVVLTGISDSGKTAIFSKVIFNKPKKSVTSLKENEATLGDPKLKLIDLPGSDRLRSRYWDQHRDKVHHVVFVVDSSTIESKLRDLSEYLYVLLADGIIHKNRARFTIACHKQDADGAKRKDAVKSLLEKELNAIRDTKKGQLGKISDEEDEDYLARQAGTAISLDSLSVNLIETSINNLDQLIKVIL